MIVKKILEYKVEMGTIDLDLVDLDHVTNTKFSHSLRQAIFQNCYGRSNDSSSGHYQIV